ncbi:hypothetical protein DNTS_030153, partial [Danionella cerebrum]
RRHFFQYGIQRKPTASPRGKENCFKRSERSSAAITGKRSGGTVKFQAKELLKRGSERTCLLLFQLRKGPHSENFAHNQCRIHHYSPPWIFKKIPMSKQSPAWCI